MDLGQQLRSRRSRALGGTFDASIDEVHTDVPPQIPSFSKSCLDDDIVGSPRIAASRDHKDTNGSAPRAKGSSMLFSAASLEHAKQQLCGMMSWPTQAAYKRLEGCIPGDMQAVLKHGRDAFKSTTKDKQNKQG